MKKSVALIGCGALGQIIANEFSRSLAEFYSLRGVLGSAPGRSGEAARRFGCRAYDTADELLADAPDLIVEAAGVDAVRGFGASCLRRADLVILSAGALADDALYAALCAAAAESGHRLYVASGAIGGFDLIQTLCAMGHTDVHIYNEKAPASLAGAPALNGRVPSEAVPETLFTGTAREAIAGFPKNVNVAVAAAMAGPGVDAARVTIASCPGTARSLHRVELRSDTVTANIEVASAPDAANPRSSSMAAWSVVALLHHLARPIQFF